MKCKDCGKSFTYLDGTCCWYARCDLLGSAQAIGNCSGGDGEDICNCSEQDSPVWDVDLGRSNPYCIHHN